MKKSILLVLIIHFFVNQLFGQQSYYDDVNLTLEGIALKNELATKITNTHSNTLSYSEAREALKIVDLVPNQGTNVYLVYGFAPELCPASSSNDNDHRRRDKSNFGGGATCEWNREHTYPQSLGTPELGDTGPGADAHMLRACDVQRNGERGNKLFRDDSGNSHTVNTDYWYPGDEWKGDMARIMMYMYLRYEDQCKPINVGYGNTIAIDPYMIDLFLDWNAEDPVSEYEENRNNYMENTSNTYGQGNRNPFIDNPYLATHIWGGQDAEDIWGIYLATANFEIDNSIVLYPNPSQKILFIKGLENYNLNKISINTITGKEIRTFSGYQSSGLNLSDIANGFYILTITTPQYRFVRKIIIDNK